MFIGPTDTHLGHLGPTILTQHQPFTTDVSWAKRPAIKLKG